MTAIQGDTQLPRLRSLIREQTGISIPPSKDYLLKARMDRLVEHEGMESLEELAGRLEAGDPRARDALVRHVTTNHTYFFREPEHLDHLVSWLPAPDSRPLRIWSAAASSGEEALSIIIRLREAGWRNFLVVASDINPQVLHQARKGIYSEAKMERLSPELRQKYFRSPGQGAWQVRPEVLAHLRLKKLNLVEPLTFREPFDCIFCRNLLIYLDRPGIDAAVDTCAANLRAGGYLYLGQAEILFQVPASLEKSGSSVYRRRHSLPVRT